MAEQVSHETTLLGETVPYAVRKSTRATKARIDIDVTGVRVIVPDGSGTDPETVLTNNAAWVIEKQRKYDDYRAQIPDRTFAAGETLPYLGDPHEIVIERRSYSEIQSGDFRLATHHVEQTSIQRALETLYRRKAREYFETQADTYAAQMDVEYERIEVRNQRTKWGSCSSSGTLSLNWRLLMAPSPVVDSIVIHELAHLRERNHADAFWSIVADHDPDYEAHHQWLTEHGTEIIFTTADL